MTTQTGNKDPADRQDGPGPLSISFVLPTSDPSGGVKSTVALANQLADSGHSVRILFRKHALSVPNLGRQALNLLRGGSPLGGLAGFRGSAIGFHRLSEIEFRPGTVVIGAGMWASEQLLEHVFRDCLCLQAIHGLHVADPARMARVFSSALPKVAVSPFLVPIVQSFGGKVSAVIPNAIDPAEFYPDPGGHRPEGWGFIYSPHPAKDPETQIALFRSSRSNHPDIRVRVISTSRRHPAIERSCFTRMPSPGAIRRAYSKTKIWVIPSRSEGFSLPVLEAMACGCVVIATRCGGPEDIIRDGTDGFLVKVGDAEGMLARIRHLLADEEAYARIRRESLSTPLRFTWKESAERLVKVIGRLR